MDDGVYCKNCGAQIKGVTANDSDHREPCPNCGSRIRSFYMKAEPGVYTLKGQDVDLVYISYPEKLLATGKNKGVRSSFLTVFRHNVKNEDLTLMFTHIDL